MGVLRLAYELGGARGVLRRRSVLWEPVLVGRLLSGISTGLPATLLSATTSAETTAAGMASAISAGKQATVSSAGRKAASGAAFAGKTWRRTTTNGREATVWRKATGNGETNATAAAGEAGRSVDPTGKAWRAEHVARETGGATEADDATGNADEANRSAKYTRTAWVPARAERKTRSAAKCIFRDHRRAAGKRERQPQLESARETTKRTRASPKSSTAGAERREKAVIKERAERLAVLEKERQ